MAGANRVIRTGRTCAHIVGECGTRARTGRQEHPLGGGENSPSASGVGASFRLRNQHWLFLRISARAQPSDFLATLIGFSLRCDLFPPIAHCSLRFPTLSDERAIAV